MAAARSLPSSAPSTARASASSVEDSNRARTDTSTPNRRRTRESTRTASRECPPRWKKSSWTPTRSTPSSSAQTSASACSVPVRGATCSPQLRPGLQARQGAAVDLAVGGQRQRLQPDEGRRDHVVRQPGAQVLADLRRRGRLSGGGQVGHQPLAAGPVGQRQHRRLRHRRMPRQRRLDLPRLDAEAADLHLLVRPPQELDGAVRRAAAPGRRWRRGARRAPGPPRRRTEPARSARRSAPDG